MISITAEVLFQDTTIKMSYKSKAEIDGGSAINSNSGGGSLGTMGSMIFSCSCCVLCGAVPRAKPVFAADGS